VIPWARSKFRTHASLPNGLPIVFGTAQRRISGMVVKRHGEEGREIIDPLRQRRDFDRAARPLPAPRAAPARD
jgi:hypothetical protein